jgi:hypothetical protein
MQRDSRGRRGFGHTQDRSRVVAAEADLILEAARRVLEGATLSSIVDDWNRRGVTTTTGGPWRINALSALLVQPRLAGRHGASIDAVPAILDSTTHDALIALRHTRRKTGTRPSGEPSGRRYLLSGLLRCWRCGSRLGGITPRAANVRPHYRCPSKGAGGCSGTVIHALHADEAARDLVIDHIDDPDFTRSVDVNEELLAAEERAMAALVADAVLGKKPVGDEPVDLWTGDRGIDDQAWRRLKGILEAKARSSSELTRPAILEQRKLCGSGRLLRASWPDMDLDGQRQVIEAVADHFVVLAAPRRRSRFTSERLQPAWLV